MTLMEEYKWKIDQLVIQLTHLERNEYDEYIINLAQEAARKLKEMMKIVEDVGTINGTMAEIISIISKD